MISKLKIIPLGGLGEIGKNMTAYECGSDIIIVDAGMGFPDEDMYGIDIVLPDITYLKANAEKIRGLILTHGHEDHIGGVSYLLRDLDIPIYTTPLTAALVELKLEEHDQLYNTQIFTKKDGSVFRLGCFTVEFIHVNHSIPDSVALAITTPIGTVIHTGDFKIDVTPIAGSMIDIARLGQLGNEGVLALLSDSTNVEQPGHSASERKVGESFDKLFMGCDKRIIITTFASNVHRLQQIINVAAKYNRKVGITGRSMENVLHVASVLGYMDIPENVMVDIDKINKLPRNQTVIISTGSQGETMSALYRMAYGSHKQVEVNAGDRILIAASAIPGNEKSINNMVNELYKQGAEVIYDRSAAIHVSGHACQEDLKLMLGLCKPKYFIPVHGEYRMLVQHAGLAREMGVNPKNILITEIGRPVEISENSARLGNPVPSGRLLVDGLGIGDVGTAVLRDRKHLSEDGLLIVVVTVDATTGVVIAGPDIVSRGFVYVKEAEALMEELRTISQMALDRCSVENLRDWNSLKTAIKGDVSDYLFKKTKRSPMVLPIIQEI